MLVNAVITAWSKRTGSDKAGQPTFAAQTLLTDVPCFRAALHIAQQANLAAAGVTADESVVYRVTNGVGPGGEPGLDVQAGDLVTVGGSEAFVVAKALRVDKGPVSSVTLWLRRLTA